LDVLSERDTHKEITPVFPKKACFSTAKVQCTHRCHEDPPGDQKKAYGLYSSVEDFFKNMLRNTATTMAK